MSETVKLIIEIPQTTYEDLKVGKIYSSLCEAPQGLIEGIQNGKPLSEVLDEIKGEWYPLTYRTMTEDELKDYEGWIDYLHPEETKILDCHLPDSGAEVLITSNGYVGIDTFYNEDGECYFESANIDEVTAWRPLPEPYTPNKESEDEK